MKKQANNGFGALWLALGYCWLLAMPVQAGGIKCWTNSEGTRECGAAVPPEHAQQGHKEYSQKGGVTKKIDRAPTREEIEAESRLRREREERDRIAKEKSDAQQRADKTLLDTFNSLGDLERSRNEKLQDLKSKLRFLEDRNQKLNDKLSSNLEIALKREEEGNEVSENLKATLSALRDQIKENSRSIDGYKKQSQELEEQYAKHIARFKILKGLK